MGTTGYCGLTAAQAKAQELQGQDVLFSSGNWYACRAQSGAVFAVYLITRRYGDEFTVKAVTSDMGPGDIPGEGFYRRYVKAAGNRALNQYETDWREACEANYTAKAKGKALKPGTTFTTIRPYDYNAFGRVSEFTLVDRKRRIATIAGGARVRLPRGWEANLKEVLA